jgi:hypothetical protein
MKHHYEITTVDSLTSKTISFHVHGKLTTININNKIVRCIVNEYNTPLYIETINTINIVKEEL